MSFPFQQGSGKYPHRSSFLRGWLVALLRAFLAIGVLQLTTVFVITGWTQAARVAPATTGDHVTEQGWWPTKRPVGSESFAGDAACAKCHAPFARSGNAMRRAAFHASGTPESGQPAPDTFQSGPYTYAYVHQDPGYALEVKMGSESLRSKIEWTFGAGNHGQTYLLQEGDALYEAQVSSFANRSLGLTPGHVDASEGSLQHALGNRLSSFEAARCFSCHTTDWSKAGKLDLAGALPGVHCEACHGPGAAHIAAVQTGRMADAAKAILNPKDLSPAASVDFCGACHRTSMDIVLTGSPAGVSSLRFQPYRLEKSRCWKETGDARVACTGCHNPHEPVVHDIAFYDRKCVSCHSTPPSVGHSALPAQQASSKPLVCPKATSNCTSCHMPRYTVPEMHSEFIDHFIRIVRPNEQFPR